MHLSAGPAKFAGPRRPDTARHFFVYPPPSPPSRRPAPAPPSSANDSPFGHGLPTTIRSNGGPEAAETTPPKAYPAYPPKETPSPLFRRLLWMTALFTITLLSVLTGLTAGGVGVENQTALGTSIALAGLLVWLATVWRIFSIARLYYNQSMSREPREIGGLQQQRTRIEIVLVLEYLFLVSAAVMHWGIFIADNGSWSNLGDLVRGTSNHFYVYWIALLDTTIAAIGAASATRFVVQTVLAQVWLIIVVTIWRLEGLLLLGQVIAAEFARRDRRRDHDPTTV